MCDAISGGRKRLVADPRFAPRYTAIVPSTTHCTVFRLT